VPRLFPEALEESFLLLLLLRLWWRFNVSCEWQEFDVRKLPDIHLETRRFIVTIAQCLCLALNINLSLSFGHCFAITMSIYARNVMNRTDRRIC